MMNWFKCVDVNDVSPCSSSYVISLSLGILRKTHEMQFSSRSSEFRPELASIICDEIKNTVMNKRIFKIVLKYLYLLNFWCNIFILI